MLDRLEKFHAPKSWRCFVPGAIILLIVLLACKLDMRSAVTDSKVQAEATARGAVSSTTVRVPFAHPLGCPEEDETGKKLYATMSVLGERRPRCAYK